MAEGKSTSSLLIAIAVALAVAAMLVLILLEAPPDAAPTAEEPMPAEHLTAEEPERLPIPRGLKGLSFGATVAEARAAFPDAACDDPFMHLLVLEPAEPTPPGPWLQCETRIGTQDADCDLFFSVGDRLSGMVCRVHTSSAPEVYDAVLTAIRETLVNNHGPAHRHWENDDPFGLVVHDDGWVWEDERAYLELRSNASGLMLINLSTEHRAAVTKMKADAARAAEESARRQAREEQRMLEEIENNRAAFDHDL